MTTDEHPVTGGAASKPATAGPGFPKRVLRWLAATARVERARAALPVLTEQQQTFVNRAYLAREAANRTFEPPEPLPGGSGKALALDLYRQAAYWALLSVQASSDRPTPGDLWAGTESIRQRTGMSESQLVELEQLFATEKGFVAFAEVDEKFAVVKAELLRGFVDRLLEIHEAPKRELQYAQIRRWFGILTPIVLLGIALALLLPLLLKPVDLAKGAPWRTSSVLVVCEPEKGVCGGAQTRIFFHTRDELNPWFEIDLGEPTRFSSMTIRNRSDFSDRAIPLVVEVSDDAKTYRPIARRTKDFSVWEPEFPAQTARFVRLRVDRQSMLHLEAVEIHP